MTAEAEAFVRSCVCDRERKRKYGVHKQQYNASQTMTDYLCTVTPLKCIRNCFIFFSFRFPHHTQSHTHRRTIRMLVCLIVVDVVFVFLYLLAFCSIHKSIVFQFILYRNAGDDFFPLLALFFHLRRIVVEQPKQKPKMKQKNREQRQRQFWKFQNSPALMRSLSLSRALGFNIDFYSYGIVNPRRQTQHKNDMKMMEEEEKKSHARARLIHAFLLSLAGGKGITNIS